MFADVFLKGDDFSAKDKAPTPVPTVIVKIKTVTVVDQAQITVLNDARICTANIHVDRANLVVELRITICSDLAPYDQNYLHLIPVDKHRRSTGSGRDVLLSKHAIIIFNCIT